MPDLSHRKSASATTSSDSCSAQGKNKINALYKINGTVTSFKPKVNLNYI